MRTIVEWGCCWVCVGYSSPPSPPRHPSVFAGLFACRLSRCWRRCKLTIDSPLLTWDKHIHRNLPLSQSRTSDSSISHAVVALTTPAWWHKGFGPGNGLKWSMRCTLVESKTHMNKTPTTSPEFRFPKSQVALRVFLCILLYFMKF